MKPAIRLATLIFVTMLPSFSLQAGEPVRLETRAYWGHTGQHVEKGRSYRVKIEWYGVADGDGWMRIPVRDLNGWPDGWQRVAAAPLFWLRRRPFDPWFALIGTVNCANPFRIQPGKHLQEVKSEKNVSWSEPFAAPASGEFVCYFNDAPWAYGNNHGSIVIRLVPCPDDGKEKRSE